MPTFTITDEAVTVHDDRNDSMTVTVDSIHYDEACQAAMSADWHEFREIALRPEPTPEPTMNETLDIVRGWLADELVSAEELGLAEIPAVGEHDLSNWNGSPIFYDNEEQAREQANNSRGFWKFHDFGLFAAIPSKYRYATVPTGFGPTAPDGYDWVCLKRK